MLFNNAELYTFAINLSLFFPFLPWMSLTRYSISQILYMNLCLIYVLVLYYKFKVSQGNRQWGQVLEGIRLPISALQ